MRVVYKLGLIKRAASLHSNTWYVASYYYNGSKVVVTHLARAYYEDVVDGPGPMKVAFKTGKRKYGRVMDTTQLRKKIAEAIG